MGHPEFKASNGWFEKFKKRLAINIRKISGEASAVDEEKLKEWQTTVLPAILAEYSPENTFNLDETGLFYELLPSKTLEFKSKFWFKNLYIAITESPIAGLKDSYKRCTLVPVVNESGTEKKLLAIGSAKNPRCFRSDQPIPVDYAASPNAWMTAEIFADFIRQWDEDLVIFYLFTIV